MSDNKKLSSYINEIRAYDLYTLTSLPTDITTPVDDFVSPGGRVSPQQDSSASESDPHLRSKYIMKRFLGKKYSNLPVLKEEDGGLSRSPESSGASGMSKYLGDSGPSGLSNYFGVSREEFPTTDVAESDNDVESSSNEDDDIDDMYILEDQTSGCADESWVDLSKQTSQPSGNSSPFTKVYSSPQGAMSYGASTPERVTPPPFGNGEEYLRLLREAQKESNQSSARVSLASSRRDTPRDSPKSPPNSPNTEAVQDNEEPSLLKGVYINYYNREGDFVRVEKNIETDWIWDWSSRPDQTPPKQWKFVHPNKGTVRSRRGASIRRLMVGNSSLFSRDVLYTLFITNVLSLILGTGIGMWLSRKSGGGGNGSNVPLAIVPIN